VASAVFLLAIVSTATAKYGGGSGTAQDPYRIATAADLIALGETPEDYDKHFLLTADIDLDPRLPGRKAFDKAVIASGDLQWAGHTRVFQGTPFTGTFDGGGHTISHLTIAGASGLGLFGQLGSGAEVKDLGVVDVNITGHQDVGGLVGRNGALYYQAGGIVTRCYSTGAVGGDGNVGGLVGSNVGHVTTCYSTGTVGGWWSVGGLAGWNYGDLTHCYSAGLVSSTGNAGGLVGESWSGNVLHSVWDIETSGVLGSAGGIGLTKAEMMDPQMLGLNGFANDPNWVLDAGRDYPRLAWQGTPGQIIPKPDIKWLEGVGTAKAPYRIDTADQLILLSKASILWDKHFVLGADIDLDPNLPGQNVFTRAVIQVFTGVFDGNGHTISHLTIKGVRNLGLFGQLASAGQVKNLGVVDVNVTGGGYVGGLVGENWGEVTQCYSTGAISGYWVGGLVGFNPWGTVTQCYAAGAVSGTGHGQFSRVGGLVGCNGSDVTQCYSTGAVSGTSPDVGGLVGYSYVNTVTACFWDIQTSGQAKSAGGTGKTTAEMQTAKTFLDAGWDFVGETKNGTEDIWKIAEGLGYPRLSWEKYSGGTGEPKDPYQIATAADLIALGETPGDYDKYFILTADIDLDPNLPGRKVFGKAVIARDTNTTEYVSEFQGAPFTGVIDGKGHVISHLTIRGKNYVGLLGRLVSKAEVRDLGVVDIDIIGSGDNVGGLVGSNSGSVTNCYSTGPLSGTDQIGGLVGYNDYGGSITNSWSAGTVSGNFCVGGLVGFNEASIRTSYSVGEVRGTWQVGGLVGWSHNLVTGCCSTGAVRGDSSVGGLVGRNGDSYPSVEVTRCYSTGAVTGNSLVGGLVGCRSLGVTACIWDTQTSGQAASAGGTGKTTAEMQTGKTFLDAGWDFVGETKNGTEDIWWILEGKDYPRLWWEAHN
jgi:hypothetical protein